MRACPIISTRTRIWVRHTVAMRCCMRRYTKLLCGEEKEVMPNDNTLIAPPIKKAPLRYAQTTRACVHFGVSLHTLHIRAYRYDTVTGTTNGSKVYIVYENGRACE